MKTKRRISKKMAMDDASSPIPDGGMPDESTCGHGGCGVLCRVRYVGPTSHVRDHHILHAARGVTHIWSAAIVTGLAIVITGAIAYNTSAQATEAAVARQRPTELQQVMQRLATMEDQMKQMRSSCEQALQATAPAPDGGVDPGTETP